MVAKANRQSRFGLVGTGQQRGRVEDLAQPADEGRPAAEAGFGRDVATVDGREDFQAAAVGEVDGPVDRRGVVTRGKQGAVEGAVVVAGGRLHGSGASDGVLHIFGFSAGRITSEKSIRVIPADDPGVVAGIAIGPDGRSAVVSVLYSSKVLRVDLVDGSVKKVDAQHLA